MRKLGIGLNNFFKIIHISIHTVTINLGLDSRLILVGTTSDFNASVSNIWGHICSNWCGRIDTFYVTRLRKFSSTSLLSFKNHKWKNEFYQVSSLQLLRWPYGFSSLIYYLPKLFSCVSLRSHGLWPTRLLCPWNSPGKNTGAGCHIVSNITFHFCINLIFSGCRILITHYWIQFAKFV